MHLLVAGASLNHFLQHWLHGPCLVWPAVIIISSRRSILRVEVVLFVPYLVVATVWVVAALLRSWIRAVKVLRAWHEGPSCFSRRWRGRQYVWLSCTSKTLRTAIAACRAECPDSRVVDGSSWLRVGMVSVLQVVGVARPSSYRELPTAPGLHVHGGRQLLQARVSVVERGRRRCGWQQLQTYHFLGCDGSCVCIVVRVTGLSSKHANISTWRRQGASRWS